MCRGFWRGDNRKAMAQDYDVVLKLLFRSKSSQAVREIAGGAVKRWLDKELPGHPEYQGGPDRGDYRRRDRSSGVHE